jgi:pimeloyl-ACP methyl ester carboxylesterase
VNGTRLYYEVAGSGDPVVLVHGNFADRRHWDDQFEVFARRHRTIRYDVRGFGKSNLPVEGEPYTHHDDLAALTRHLGVEKAHIVGLSMGSGIAVDFVLMHPEMASSLVSVGPWVNGYDSPAVQELFDMFAEMASALEEGGADAVIEVVYDDPAMAQLDTTTVNRLKSFNREYSWWHMTHLDPWTDIEPSAGGRLGEISVPTLVVTAEYDIDACKEIADLMEESIDGATKVVLQDASHIMNMDKPEEFNRLVLDFFRDVESD